MFSASEVSAFNQAFAQLNVDSAQMGDSLQIGIVSFFALGFAIFQALPSIFVLRSNEWVIRKVRVTRIRLVRVMED